MPWTLLTDRAGHPGWWQMALDQALLEEAAYSGAGFVRLYRWDPWVLSFGRHEPALRRYDRSRITGLGLDTVRRPTGGRAVWHARELTYMVAAPVATFGGLAESYRSIHTILAAALARLGVPATLAPPVPAIGVGAGACFASAAGGEVLVRGRKLIGSAQLRQGGAFLQHGSLLMEDDQRLVAEVSIGAAPPGGEIVLREIAPLPVSFDDAAEVVASEFRTWGGTWGGAADLDLERLVARHAARFRDPGWTWRR